MTPIVLDLSKPLRPTDTNYNASCVCNRVVLNERPKSQGDPPLCLANHMHVRPLTPRQVNQFEPNDDHQCA